MVLNLYMQAAHPAPHLLTYEPVLDQYMEGRRYHAFNCQLRVNCPLEEGYHCATNPKMHKPGQVVTPFNSILTK